MLTTKVLLTGESGFDRKPRRTVLRRAGGWRPLPHPAGPASLSLAEGHEAATPWPVLGPTAAFSLPGGLARRLPPQEVARGGVRPGKAVRIMQHLLSHQRTKITYNYMQLAILNY